MCVYSMVSGHYQGLWPDPQQYTPPLHDYRNYQELIRKAKLYDEMMKQPDCPDPAKVKWQDELERVMREKYGLLPK